MKDLKGTKTIENLMAAFAGESQARNKYNYYASKAREEGYNQIGDLFDETALNEKEHAKLWFKLAHGIDCTVENLLDAAAGEQHEWTSMYKRMAEEAREEGFHRIADLFAAVPGLKAFAGKMKQPWMSVADAMWDGDINPEGFAGSYKKSFGTTNVFGRWI